MQQAVWVDNENKRYAPIIHKYGAVLMMEHLRNQGHNEDCIVDMNRWKVGIDRKEEKKTAEK